MKQKFKNATTFLLVTVLALSIGVFTLRTESFHKVKADTAVSTGFNNFAQSYFSNLKENFGNNALKSHAQVSLGMLLSYYDTCLNDNVIPEAYDFFEDNENNSNFYNRGKSPGVRYADSLSDEEDVSALIQVASVLQEIGYFCEKLICMGNNLGYYGDDCSLTVQETANLLNYYLQQETPFESSDYSITYETYASVPVNASINSNNKINEVIQLVQSGKPVILFVVKINEDDINTTTQHTVIAYDYDSVNNKLYCHFGEHLEAGNDNFLDVKSHVMLGGESNDESDEWRYNQHFGYIAIDWNIEHTCSNNYELNGNFYCYEHKDLVIYNHLCSYTDGIQEFERGNTTGHTKHKKMCHCTNYEEEFHNSTCSCYISPHIGSTYTYYNPTQHSYVCTLCGVTAYASHVAKKNNPGFCISCNFFFDSGFGQIIHSIKPNGAMVTANGSYIGYNGIIYLDDRDVEAYFNGTLVFYKEDSSSQTA